MIVATPKALAAWYKSVLTTKGLTQTEVVERCLMMGEGLSSDSPIPEDFASFNVLVADLNNGSKFSCSPFRKFVCSQGNAGADAGFTVKIPEKFRCTVNDLRMLFKIFGAAHETCQMNKLFDTVQIA